MKAYTKMEKTVIKFGDFEIEKKNWPISIKDKYIKK